jgi:hypothetical protein
MIQFRCWFCNKRYAVADQRAGERMMCTCARPVRVPKQNGGSSKVRTATDWVVEIILCGGGGALLGACLAFVIISRIQLPAILLGRWYLLAGLTLVGFLVGAFGGMRGLDWIGRKIRDRENS